jgi:hypothetical protein
MTKFTMRWTWRRKAALVKDVAHGVVKLEEVCHEHAISLEEFNQWKRLIEQHGPQSLRATRLQDYRLPVPVPSPIQTRKRVPRRPEEQL